MKDARPAIEEAVTAADALRPFLREGEQIVWCSWQRRTSKKQLFFRISLLSAALTAAPLLGLLLAEVYRWYAVHEFNYPVYFMGFAILLGLGLTMALVHAEGDGPAPCILAITSRRVITVSFEKLAVDTAPQESFDLEILSEAMAWLNFDEIEEIDVFAPTGCVTFKGSGPRRVLFGELESLQDVISLLPDRVISKLDKAERLKLENHAKARKAH